MSLQLDLLDRPLEPVGSATGAPLQLAVDSVDEDPEQPRHEFDAEKLQELAETVAQRGVRDPISVRPHPTEAGRWMINSGARRLRAARLAGRPEIPAFVDVTADSYDQVIENEQRENLTPLELAMFIQRRLALGETQVEVARRLGKSRSYIAFACALIDAPDWLMRLYRDGRCRGINELYQLRRLYDQSPQQVVDWAEGRNCIVRPDVAELKAQMERQSADEDGTVTGPTDPLRGPNSSGPQLAAPPPAGPGDSSRTPRPDKVRPALLARHDGSVVEILLDRVPELEGHLFVRTPGRQDRRCTSVQDLSLLGFGNAQPTVPRDV